MQSEEGKEKRNQEKQREEPENSQPTYVGHIHHGLYEEQMQGCAISAELTKFLDAWGGLLLLLTLLVLLSWQVSLSGLSLFIGSGLCGTARFSLYSFACLVICVHSL